MQARLLGAPPAQMTPVEAAVRHLLTTLVADMLPDNWQGAEFWVQVRACRHAAAHAMLPRASVRPASPSNALCHHWRRFTSLARAWHFTSTRTSRCW
jgi:hypothetical protein